MLGCYLGRRNSIKEVLTEDSVEDWSTESSASVTKGHPRKFFFQSLPLGRVRGFSKSLHAQQETFLLGFSCSTASTAAHSSIGVIR